MSYVVWLSAVWSLNGINNYFISSSSIFSVSFKLQMSKCKVRPQGFGHSQNKGPKKRLQLSPPVPHLGSVPCRWGEDKSAKGPYCRQYKTTACFFFPWLPICLTNACLVVPKYILEVPKHILVVPRHTLATQVMYVLGLQGVQYSPKTCITQPKKCLESIFFEEKMDRVKGQIM
jgi:hypothetical protein